MNAVLGELFSQYWSAKEVVANIVIVANIVGALLLGLLVGYERAYHGRAAGMRTYGLVCMASCALVVVAGYPSYWFGASGQGELVSKIAADPTRVIQGVVTGIGFLGAGIITREGLNINGLTTAASIWASSAIGILVGVGFYASAILVTALSIGLMMWAVRLERWLPTRQAVAIDLGFRAGFQPDEKVLRRVAGERGYELVQSSLHIQEREGRQEWRFVAVAMDRELSVPMSELARELASFAGVESYQISYARN